MKDTDTINQFIREYSLVEGLDKETIDTYKRELPRLAGWLGKDLKEPIIKDDIFRVIEEHKKSGLSSKPLKVLKTFGRYYNWPQEILKLLKFKEESNNLTSNDILSQEEIVRMVKAGKNAEDRAFTLFLYEGSFRFSEINNLTLGSLSFKKDYVDATISVSKTYARTLSLVAAKPFLEQYIQEEHEFSKDKKSYLFYGRDFNTKGKVNDANPYKPMSHTAMLAKFKEIAKRANIDKKIWLHLARHSRLSYLCQYIKEAELRFFAGWSGSSRMPQIYFHINSQDVSRSYLGNVLGQDKNGKEPQDTRIKSERCKQCGQANFVSDKLCLRCNAVIEPKLRNVMEIEGQIAEFLNLAEVRELAKRFLTSKQT